MEEAAVEGIPLHAILAVAQAVEEALAIRGAHPYISTFKVT